MKLKVNLKDANISQFNATGELEKKLEDDPLKEMLKKIKNGGMNTFLNDNDLKNHAKRLQSSFKKEGLIDSSDLLTQIGEDVVKTGKAWKSLSGLFKITICEYKGRIYVLDVEIDKESKNDFSEKIQGKKILDNYSFKTNKCEVKNIKLDPNVIDTSYKGNNVSVEFDYETKQCKINAELNSQKYTFETEESSKIKFIDYNNALSILKESCIKYNCFSVNNTEISGITIEINEPQKINEIEKEIISFYESGKIKLELNKDDNDYLIEDIALRINANDMNTGENLLYKYLLKESDNNYIGYSEVGAMVTQFQNLFESIPPITESTKNIYNNLMKEAKDYQEKYNSAYLHLKAYIDLSPESVIKPYIEKTIDFSNKKASFQKIVNEIFQEERDIKSISTLTKYASSNNRISRALIVLAETIKFKYGISLTVITTGQTKNNQSSCEYYNKMKNDKSIKLIERDFSEIEKIHDRYFKINRKNNEVEWWKLSGELDALRFDNDFIQKQPRGDIKPDTEGFAGEMTFVRVSESGIPETLNKIMEDK